MYSEDEFVELTESQLGSIAAGTSGAGTTGRDILIHKNCGGILLNADSPYVNVLCDKCGEEHFWLRDFEYEIRPGNISRRRIM